MALSLNGLRFAGTVPPGVRSFLATALLRVLYP